MAEEQDVLVGDSSSSYVAARVTLVQDSWARMFTHSLLVPDSQHERLLVTEATASVHFSAQPDALFPL
jgi:hypothetical protein